MIIATDNLNYEVIKLYINNPSGLINYVDSLVPVWLRHIKSITYNQRYYVAVHLRDLKSIPYKDKMCMVNSLVKGIHLTGNMTDFVTIDTILQQCNIPVLVEMLTRNSNG